MSKKIETVEELMSYDIISFKKKPLTKNMYRNWQLWFALEQIKNGTLEVL